MTVDPNKIRALGQELRTQDNKDMANPIFVVQERVMIDGMDIEFADETRWFLDGHDQMFTEEEAIAEAGSENVLWNSNQWGPVGIVWRWEYVSAHLTRKSAERYTQTYAHRHKHGLRVYVASQQGVQEWTQAIEYLRADSWVRWNPDLLLPEGEYWVAWSDTVAGAILSDEGWVFDDTGDPIEDMDENTWIMPRVVPDPPNTER